MFHMKGSTRFHDHTKGPVFDTILNHVLKRGQTDQDRCRFFCTEWTHCLLLWYLFAWRADESKIVSLNHSELISEQVSNEFERNFHTACSEVFSISGRLGSSSGWRLPSGENFPREILEGSRFLASQNYLIQGWTLLNALCFDNVDLHLNTMNSTQYLERHCLISIYIYVCPVAPWM